MLVVISHSDKKTFCVLHVDLIQVKECNYDNIIITVFLYHVCNCFSARHQNIVYATVQTFIQSSLLDKQYCIV